MRLWRKLIRSYFTFINREKRGLNVLLIVFLILSSIHLVVRLQPRPEIELTYGQLAMIKQLEQAKESKVFPNDSVNRREAQSENPKKPIQWEIFDPNIVDSQTLVSTGLDAKIARRLLNYRKSGVSFKSAADLSKIYGMDVSWLKAVSNYVQIQPMEESLNQVYRRDSFRKDSFKQKSKRLIPWLELNKADSVSLVQLPWVGPFYASEIVKLRNNLGGYRSYTQLLDIYEIRDKTFESLIEHTTLDTALLGKANINLVDLKRLGYHPYLT